MIGEGPWGVAMVLVADHVGERNHPIFPERANISLAQVTSRGGLRLRTWERGAGLTKACGTAACAAAVAAARKGLTDRQVTVELPGGRAFHRLD